MSIAFHNRKLHQGTGISITRSCPLFVGQEKSRGWYEEDDIFQARITASRAAWEAQDKSAKKVTKKPAVAAATSSSRKPNAWNTTSVSKPRAAPVSNSTTKSKPKANGGGVFAAMMMDSDSD